MNDFYTHVDDPWEASVEAGKHLADYKYHRLPDNWKPRRKLVIYAPPLYPFLLLTTMGMLLLTVIVV